MLIGYVWRKHLTFFIFIDHFLITFKLLLFFLPFLKILCLQILLFKNMVFTRVSQLPSPEEINHLQQASLVSNTEKNTSKWLRVVDRFNKSCGISQAIELIDSVNELEDYLCKFITWLKKNDGTDYKVESIHNCYSAINRYLKEHSILQPVKIWDRYKFPHALRTLDGKMRILQSKGLGDPKKSDGLSSKEIKQILDHEYMNTNSNESLTRRIFFWLCLLCGLRGGDAYRIRRKDIERRRDGG